MSQSPSRQSAPAKRRPALQSDDSDNLAAIVAADRAFPAAVAELDSGSMKARDIINHRIRETLNRPSGIAQMVCVLFFFSMGFWHVFLEGRGPETWVYRCGAGIIVIVTGLEAIRESRHSKKPVVCPHCEKPLFLERGW